MPMHNLIEYSENCSETSESLYKFCRVVPKYTTADFESFKFKLEFLNITNNAGVVHD